MTNFQATLTRLLRRLPVGMIALITSFPVGPLSMTCRAEPRELPKIQFDGSDAAQHRLHEAIHAAHLLVEIGAGYEAVRVLRAIAEQAGNHEPGEHASQVLREWGIDPSEIDELSIDRLVKTLQESREQQHNRESTIVHVRNLVQLRHYERLAQILKALAKSDLKPAREKLHEICELIEISPDHLKPEVTENQLVNQLRTTLTIRHFRLQARLIGMIDPQASDLAQILLQQLHPIDRDDRDDEWERHPLFRGESDDEDRSEEAEEWPHTHEIIPELLKRAREWRTDCPPLTRFLISLVRYADNEGRFARSARPIEEPIKTTKEQARPLPDREDPGAELFEPVQLRHYRISLSDEAIEQLREEPKHYVRGTFHEGEQRYPNVGIRIKGSWGSFRELESNNKTAFTVKFNQFVKGQRFHGLRRIILNNAVQDPSYLREAIGYSLFRDAGIPAPRISYATLQVNGKSRGLYVQVEAVTKDFLQRWYDQTHGNLYEGPGDVLEWKELDLDTNQGREDRNDLRQLAKAIEKADDRTPWERLSQHVELEAFARFIAMEQLVWHWDGYTQTNNYRIYFNPQTAKFEFFPHGGDQLFEEVGGSIFRSQGGILSRALLQTESGKETYLRVMNDLLNRVWNEDEIISRVGTIYTLIRPYLLSEKNRTNQLVEFEHTVSRVLHFVAMRRYAVLREARPARFSANWREGSEFGHSFFFEEFRDWH